MSARVMRVAGWALVLAGAGWAALWLAWAIAQHHAGKLDAAAALLAVVLLVLLPTSVVWGGAAVVLVRAGRRAREEREAALERRLLEAIRTRGRVRLASLAREWRLPERSLAAALERVVGLGIFHGRVDWERGEVFGEGVSPEGRCPHCGGEVVPAGQGLLACRHCGSRFPVAEPASAG